MSEFVGSDEKPSAFQRHLAIGKAALIRGILDMNELARAMYDAGASAAEDDAFWTTTERLTNAQLAQISAEIHAPTVVTARKQAWPAESPQAPLSAAERYQPIQLRGRGGMGSVFECEDTQLGRKVALKSVRKDYAGNRQDAVRMLTREARLTGGLQHPNIIPIYDAGHHVDFGPHFVMRLIDQPTLADVLREIDRGDKAIEEEYRLGRLLRYFIQICQALEYGHSRGVVHCDLKPSNILLGAFGEVLVVDWGLAYSVEEGVVYRGGTLGYMAPEQLDPRRTAFDARTDVFALGCILYEIITLRMAFPDVSLSSVLDGIGLKPPRRPREVAAARNIPEDLEEIALRAVAIDPAQRYATAGEIAVAIEAVVEGTKERERRRARADELAMEGDNLATSCFEHYAARPNQVAEIAALRASTMGWEPPEKKQELWEAEDRLEVNDHIGMRLLQAAISGYEQALAQIPEHPRARAGLLRLYRGELERAIRSHDEFNRLYFEELVRLYDDAASETLEHDEATLYVACDLSPTTLRLARIEERGRRLIPTEQRVLGVAPIAGLVLPPGHYVLCLSHAEMPDVHHPLELIAGAILRLRIELAGAVDRLPGEIFVPAGPALLGGENAQATRADLSVVEVPAFIIAAAPVSTADYLVFLDELYRESPELAQQHVPCRADGFPFWERIGDAFEPFGGSSWGGYEELVGLPVVGIDASSAEAFAAWVSRRTGRTYRLPNEHEWEKAARGTDGRRYPWGDDFDASFCKMRESRPEAPRPEPCGAFPLDRSPYGVMDMAGGVADWVVPTGGEPLNVPGDRLMVTRGGAWCDWQSDCVLGARRSAWASERAARVGFRLARSVTR